MKPLILSSLIILTAQAASAVVLLGTNFDGRVLSTTTSTNDTARGLVWTTNGIADPGALTAVPSQIDPFGGDTLANFRANGLFENGDNANRFAPDLNIHNEGTWTVNVPLKVLGAGIVIDNVTLDAYTLNNGGNPQGVGRDLNISVALFDAGSNSLGELTENDVFVHAAASPPQPTPVDFQTGGLAVPAGDYTMRLSFGADNDLVGNNAGFDNLVVNGTVVPEPTTGLLLFGCALIGFLRRRR